MGRLWFEWRTDAPLTCPTQLTASVGEGKDCVLCMWLLAFPSNYQGALSDCRVGHYCVYTQHNTATYPQQSTYMGRTLALKKSPAPTQALKHSQRCHGRPTSVFKAKRGVSFFTSPGTQTRLGLALCLDDVGLLILPILLKICLSISSSLVGWSATSRLAQHAHRHTDTLTTSDLSRTPTHPPTHVRPNLPTHQLPPTQGSQKHRMAEPVEWPVQHASSAQQGNLHTHRRTSKRARTPTHTPAAGAAGPQTHAERGGDSSSRTRATACVHMPSMHGGLLDLLRFKKRARPAIDNPGRTTLSARCHLCVCWKGREESVRRHVKRGGLLGANNTPTT